MSDLKSIQLARSTYMDTIPSTKEKVKIKPFTVGDEKILLIASETEDTAQMAEALTSVVHRCVEGKTDKLESYDYEYLFLKIRAVSVGESSEIGIKCQECDSANLINVNMSDIQVKQDKEHSGTIKFSDELAFKMRIPSLQETANVDASNVDHVFDIILQCVDTVYFGEDSIKVDEQNRSDLSSIVDQLTTDQFMMMRDFYESIPKVGKDIQFICGACGHDNKLKLEGLASFF